MREKAEEILNRAFLKHNWHGDNSVKDTYPIAITAITEALQLSEEKDKEIEKLKKFKAYVHDRLDKIGVPNDPEPENNKSHGCRIEGRLNFIEQSNRELLEALNNVLEGSYIAYRSYNKFDESEVVKVKDIKDLIQKHSIDRLQNS